MKTKIYFSVFLIAFILFSCNKNSNEEETNSITFTEIGKGALYGNGAEGITQSNLVITINTDWQNLMNQMNSVNNVTDNFTETNIDFGTYEIIAVFDIIRPHNNFDITITDVIENTNNIVITISETSNDNGYTIMNQPFHIIKIPFSNKPIIFD